MQTSLLGSNPVWLFCDQCVGTASTTQDRSEKKRMLTRMIRRSMLIHARVSSIMFWYGDGVRVRDNDAVRARGAGLGRARVL